MKILVPSIKSQASAYPSMCYLQWARRQISDPTKGGFVRTCLILLQCRIKEVI